ncbi:hypothetical protein RR48_15466 [Papilio machaon]|uniref:Uncharacterized protein n=1 Tax=Papilio machaon TaxID=76193 RepID=A0A194QWI7_PAPMA|nr:hypothetical protein RR48_15466 [Papilio machaon]
MAGVSQPYGSHKISCHALSRLGTRSVLGGISKPVRCGYLSPRASFRHAQRAHSPTTKSTRNGRSKKRVERAKCAPRSPLSAVTHASAPPDSRAGVAISIACEPYARRTRAFARSRPGSHPYPTPRPLHKTDARQINIQLDPPQPVCFCRTHCRRTFCYVTRKQTPRLL